VQPQQPYRRAPARPYRRYQDRWTHYWWASSDNGQGDVSDIEYGCRPFDRTMLNQALIGRMIGCDINDDWMQCGCTRPYERACVCVCVCICARAVPGMVSDLPRGSSNFTAGQRDAVQPCNGRAKPDIVQLPRPGSRRLTLGPGALGLGAATAVIT